MPARNDIPDKVYFRIGEVSDLVGVDTHVLRYWETEFKQIRPRRAKSNQRLYRRQDVENVVLIKALLHEEGYTISGAKNLLEKKGKEGGAPLPREGVANKQEGDPPGNKLGEIKKELKSPASKTKLRDYPQQNYSVNEKEAAPLDYMPAQDSKNEAQPEEPIKTETAPIKKELKKEAPSKKVDLSKKQEREIDIAMKDPTVKNFMDTFKAQILSVEQIKKAKK